MERRHAPRLVLLGTLSGQLVPFDVKVEVRDISLGGMSIESELALAVGSQHRFRLTLGDGSHVVLSAVVVHCDEVTSEAGGTSHRAGLRFVDEHDESAGGALPKLLDRLAES